MATPSSDENTVHDHLHRRIASAVGSILERTDVLAPVEVLIAMDILAPAHLEDWRRGRVPYLERVIQGSLPRLSRILRILRQQALALGLKPSVTVYNRWGKGPRQRLRFTRTGDPGLERAYACHFVRSRARPIVQAETQPDQT
jgi:hypothetical protein